MYQSYTVFSQGLTDVEKSNIQENLKQVSADSAMTQVLMIVGPFLFESTVKDPKDIKRLYIAAEILNTIEFEFQNREKFYQLRGLIYEKLSAHKEALMDYSKAIKINPTEDNYRTRAKCKMQANDFYGAITDITKCLTFLPNDHQLYGNRAWCYLMTDQWANSQSDVTKAISLNNKTGFYYMTRGLIRLHFGKEVDGCTDLSKASDMGEGRAFDLIQQFCNNN